MVVETLHEFIAHLRELLSSLPPLTDAISQQQRDALKDALECAESARDAAERDDAVKAAVLAGVGYGAYLVLSGGADALRDSDRTFFTRRKGGRGKLSTLPSDRAALKEEVDDVKVQHPTWPRKRCYTEVASRYKRSDGKPLSWHAVEKRLRRK